VAIRFKDEIKIHPSVYLAPTVKIYGNVKIGAYSSIWDGVVIRGDLAAIEIGENTNIQENVVIHVDTDIPTKIGNNVTVGHSAVIHGATIGDNCIIAIKSVILNDARIGNDCIIGAGSIVMERSEVPSNSVVFGVPGKVVKSITNEMKNGIHKNAKTYVELGQNYKKTMEEAKYI
jgi:carbonic anhydrase/acetyltransferase-like protein (isoleucine patch superfamily)